MSFQAWWVSGRPQVDRRIPINGILRILRMGSPRRNLPAEVGSWKTCWKLFDEWNADGTLEQTVRRRCAAFADVGAVD